MRCHGRRVITSSFGWVLTRFSPLSPSPSNHPISIRVLAYSALWWRPLAPQRPRWPNLTLSLSSGGLDACFWLPSRWACRRFLLSCCWACSRSNTYVDQLNIVLYDVLFRLSVDRTRTLTNITVGVHVTLTCALFIEAFDRYLGSRFIYTRTIATSFVSLQSNPTNPIRVLCQLLS